MGFKFFKNTVLLFLFASISCGCQSSQKAPVTLVDDEDAVLDTSMLTGAEQTDLYLPLLKGKRVGLVANQTSVIPKLNNYQGINPNKPNYKADNKLSFVHLVDSLTTLGINITRVFAPEHGFRGTADAGEDVKDGIDTKTNLPIMSLHGKNRKPTPEQLKDLDIIIFDIQDVGVRFYTYISTLHYVMEACAEADIPLLILDRPNPNGQYIDGPTLDLANKSFLGMHPIPLVHGMTIGEYAQMINGENWLTNKLQCAITIIPVKFYTHNTYYSLPIRPSPNLPNDQSIKLYPSLGLFEGTNINAGRGTAFQFQCYGAPFLDKDSLKFTYTPIANFGAKHPKHKDKLCYGEDLRNEDIKGIMTLKWIIKAYKNTTDKSLFFLDSGFTKHAGTDNLQKQIEAGLSEEVIKKSWQEDLEAFKKIRANYLIYD